MPEETPKAGPKYERSSLTQEQAGKAEKLLVAVMENDKLYLDEELSLRTLSEKIGLPPAHVSQVLNDRLRKNFYDFVNGFRVEEAQRILRDPRRRDQKILGIAFDTGFASKVAFNRVFNKCTGMTPSEYKNRSQGNKSSLRT
jgi:AraC-like DNA-binding protein